jgi:hypothetical protein
MILIRIKLKGKRKYALLNYKLLIFNKKIIYKVFVL